MVALLWISSVTGFAVAQADSAPATAAQTASPAAPVAAPAAAQGGTIHGVVVAGAAGKAGGVPLPGVAITATNTLTGKKYSTSTDVDGQFAMKIPRNGRYVVRVELAGFAAATQEVVLTGVEVQAAAQGITIAEKPMNFGMELASRAEAAEAKQSASASNATLARGTQNLSLSAGGDTTDVTAGGGNSGAALPSLAGVGGSSEAANDAVTVSGQSGQMNGLASFSEDDIRQRIEDRVAEARASGQLGAGGDPTDAIVGMLGGMLGGGGPGGGGGSGGGRGGRGGGGGGGGRGGGGGGSGAFRNFNPAQPHGNIFFQGGNSALNSAPWSPSLQPLTNPSAYSNRFGASIAGSPYIPGLTQPNTKQFVFINLTGQKNLNAFLATGRVPTALERVGNFSESTLGNGSTATPVQLYDPATGLTTGPEISQNKLTTISPVAQALLSYYPAPNIATNAQGYNYQTISNAGSNNVAINTRYVRTLGGSTATPFGNFGGGGRGGRTSGPPALRQNINIGYNYSHSASDQRNIFLPLGGALESDGNGLSVGYTVSYGRLSNNATLNWNRLNSETRNYFTDTSNDPSTALGLGVPNDTGGFADPRFYNGLPTFTMTNFQSLSNTTPSRVTNQTISFSDFVAYRHSKHNYRLGFDVRRVHRDSIGGNNPLGTYAFTGYATADAADQASGNAGNQGASGDAFADFLLGLPQETEIQSDLYKIYLRENVYDWYATDDWRVASSLTVNYGIRYEYFGPYSEKDNQIVNLAPNSDFSSFTPVMPGQDGYPHGLVNPDHLMYAPRFGFAWRPKNSGWTKYTVVRGGYSINYNTGQYAVFAQKLSGQEPYAVVQTNTFASGCTTTTPSSTATMTLANGFGCSTNTTIENNWAVDKNYRLGMVQLYNLNLQRTIPWQIVLNVGYNGSKGSNLDVVGSPNGVPTSINPLGVTTPAIAPFDYEESGAGSRSNQLVVSAQQRQHKGIALGATYVYSHTIDNASGVGGAIGSPIQDLHNLAAEEGNSSFDQRHNLTGNWLIELPFGPNRAFLNKGGFWAGALDGYSISGTFTLASGTYYTPTYSGNAVESLSGSVYTQRPNRNFSQPLKGPRNLGEWFNTSAFTLPTVDGTKNTPTIYGNASQGSIEGPGTVAVSSALSRTFQLGDTRSFEARVTATNVFNTVQYSGINVNENSANFGEVTSAATMRQLLVTARYRF